MKKENGIKTGETKFNNKENTPLKTMEKHLREKSEEVKEHRTEGDILFEESPTGKLIRKGIDREVKIYMDTLKDKVSSDFEKQVNKNLKKIVKKILKKEQANGIARTNSALVSYNKEVEGIKEFDEQMAQQRFQKEAAPSPYLIKGIAVEGPAIEALCGAKKDAGDVTRGPDERTIARAIENLSDNLELVRGLRNLSYKILQGLSTGDPVGAPELCRAERDGSDSRNSIVDCLEDIDMEIQDQANDTRYVLNQIIAFVGIRS